LHRCVLVDIYGFLFTSATLGRIVVFVSEVDACANWYVKHFGFAIVEDAVTPTS